MSKYIGAIFDLDGVLVDTAIFHYMAWRKIADDLKIPFDFRDNERLKGVSRMESMSIILSLAENNTPSARLFDEREKEELSDRKNKIYVEMIQACSNLDLLPGAMDTLCRLRQKGIKIALGSSSKNAPLIIERLGIKDFFDAVIDGRHVINTKPNPEVFLLAAKKLGVAPENCVVFEDSAAGIQAARRAGMYSVGIGLSENLLDADLIFPRMFPLQILELFECS